MLGNRYFYRNKNSQYQLPLGFPGGSDSKESACNVGDLDLSPGLGRSSGEGNGYPLQYSGMENSMDCIVHGDHIFADSSSRLKYYRLFNTDSSISTKKIKK